MLQPDTLSHVHTNVAYGGWTLLHFQMAELFK